MSNIIDFLQSEEGHKIIEGVSKETNQPADKTAQVLTMGMPILMAAMGRNVKKETNSGLMGALENKHDGSILDNLGSLFQGGVSKDVKLDGLGILGHVLGGSQNNVARALSAKTGMDVSSVMQILQIAAPILLGFLGKEKKQKNIDSQEGLEGLLGGLIGNATGATDGQSLFESILDGDGDGSVIDDVAGMVLGNKKKGGLGGMLGGMFGK